MTTLPDLKPSPTRLALVHGIAQKQVQHYPWDQGPETWWLAESGLNHRKVTARVNELIRVGLAAHGDLTGYEWQRVVLTDAGWAWLDRHGGLPKEVHK